MTMMTVQSATILLQASKIPFWQSPRAFHAVAPRLRLSSSIPSPIESTRHPLLHKLPQPPKSSLLLDDTLLTVVLSSAYVSKGNINDLIDSFRFIPRRRHPFALKLALLQNTAFVGWPKVLESYAALQQAGFLLNTASPHTPSHGDGVPDLNDGSDESSEVRKRRGEMICNEIYGNFSQKLLQRYSAFDPVLPSLLLEFVYGSVFGTYPGEGRNQTERHLKERQLCAIAAIAGQSTPAVLVGHIKGAVTVGISKEELEHVMELIKVAWGKHAAERIDAVLLTYEKARYIL